MTDVLTNTKEIVKPAFVETLEVSEGDLIHVKIGGDVGTNIHYVPTAAELDLFADQFKQVVPEGVKVVVTHQLVEIVVVKTSELSNGRR